MSEAITTSRTSLRELRESGRPEVACDKDCPLVTRSRLGGDLHQSPPTPFPDTIFGQIRARYTRRASIAFKLPVFLVLADVWQRPTLRPRPDSASRTMQRKSRDLSSGTQLSQ